MKASQSRGRLLRLAGMQSKMYACLENAQSSPFDCLLLDAHLGGTAEIEVASAPHLLHSLGIASCLK
jgi:hypothetical protein